MVSTSDGTTWVERLKAGGDEQAVALEELRGILLRGLRSTVSKRGADPAFSDDIVQESLLRILDNLDSFEGRSKFTTWAMTIAVRTAVSELRRKHYKNVSLDATTDDSIKIDIPAEKQKSPAEQAEQRSILEHLQQAIDQDLTEKQRIVVRGALSGIPMEEIARRMNSNRNAVYKMFHDARQRLKSSLEAADYSPTDIQAAFN